MNSNEPPAYFRRHITQDWTANGTDVRVGTNGRHIAHTGPHHTPPFEYPAGLATEDEGHARFIAACPAIYRAAKAILAASQQSDETLMDEALDALAESVGKATTASTQITMKPTIRYTGSPDSIPDQWLRITHLTEHPGPGSAYRVTIEPIEPEPPVWELSETRWVAGVSREAWNAETVTSSHLRFQNGSAAIGSTREKALANLALAKARGPL